MFGIIPSRGLFKMRTKTKNGAVTVPDTASARASRGRGPRFREPRCASPSLLGCAAYLVDVLDRRWFCLPTCDPWQLMEGVKQFAGIFCCELGNRPSPVPQIHVSAGTYRA